MTVSYTHLDVYKRQELGCTDTHFANPSGLNNPEHYTSTYDMALIARAAFLNPTFEEIDSTTYYKLPPNSINPEGLTIYPGHKMLKKSTPYYYPDVYKRQGQCLCHRDRPIPAQTLSPNLQTGSPSEAVQNRG